MGGGGGEDPWPLVTAWLAHREFQARDIFNGTPLPSSFGEVKQQHLDKWNITIQFPL